MSVLLLFLNMKYFMPFFKDGTQKLKKNKEACEDQLSHFIKPQF